MAKPSWALKLVINVKSVHKIHILKYKDGAIYYYFFLTLFKVKSFNAAYFQYICLWTAKKWLKLNKIWLIFQHTRQYKTTLATFLCLMLKSEIVFTYAKSSSMHVCKSFHKNCERRNNHINITCNVQALPVIVNFREGTERQKWVWSVCENQACMKCLLGLPTIFFVLIPQSSFIAFLHHIPPLLEALIWNLELNSRRANP